MSEYINNATRRKETLKNVLRQLHEGKSVKEVQNEFGQLAREASSGEIAEIEQMLINEGMPVEEVQRLCDVHVAVFRAGLDDQRTPESIPGHPVHTFRQENQVILGLLDELQKNLDASDKGANLVRMESFIFLSEKLLQIDLHYRRKEYLLFPYLEKKGFMGPSKVMWGIHDQIRADLKGLVKIAQSRKEYPAILAAYTNVANSIREMTYKEEKILFPAALERLGEADWAAIRKQEGEIGYFLVKPGGEWAPVAHEDLHGDERQSTGQSTAVTPSLSVDSPSENGILPLNTGGLTLKQIDLLLRNLPVDVTYVDENDLVQFYSQTRERIFERTPSIIGRAVQNCHPPQSIARVQRILDDFRAGRRDQAAFWIPFGEKFVHIQYFALRDEQNKYCGTLEVTQDISGLRALKGEKRLLDDQP